MDSHEKQSPQRFGRYAAMLIMLLTLGVGQMWGVSICKTGTTYIYLDRTNMTSWTTSGNTYLVWRYDNSAYRAQTSNIANTKLALWYGSTGWDNITHIGYMYGSWGASGSDTWSNITDWAPDYTNSYNGSFGFTNGNQTKDEDAKAYRTSHLKQYQQQDLPKTGRYLLLIWVLQHPR